jgi:hypothetical protein
MKRYMAAAAVALALGAAPALAGQQEPAAGSKGPVQLTDSELDGVAAGDPLILVQVMAPIGVHIEPITVSVPVNVAAIVQANVLGNGSFDALAIGTQNVYNFASSFAPSP